MLTILKVPVEILSHAQDLPLPDYQTDHASGLDLVSAEDAILIPGDRRLIATGLKIAIPIGYEGQIRPRSGLSLRHGITIPNSPGTIDADYRGEVKIILWNLGENEFTIKRGDRIAQLVVVPVIRVEWERVSTVLETERGDGGFGHTGVRQRDLSLHSVEVSAFLSPC